VLFAISLPLVTPYLRGDGNGYYAWLRSAVIDHDLQFGNEYRHADPVFQHLMFNEGGSLRTKARTPNDHVVNHWGVGAAVLWTPFFLAAHVAVGVGRLSGAHWHADGFSAPYRWMCAIGTALYSFLALLIAYRVARRRVSEGAALVGAVAVWGASSLLVYQYLLPFLPYGIAGFVGAALLRIWDRPGPPTTNRWLAMGTLTGLVASIHGAAAPWGLLPLLTMLELPGGWRAKLRAAAAFFAAIPIGAAPQLVGKAIVYGSPFKSGYDGGFRWSGEQWFRVLFGANHGLFSWTPIALIAIIGVAWPLRSRDRRLANGLLVVFAGMLAMAALNSSYEQSSFGHRFFVMYTPGFVLGVAAAYEALRVRARVAALAVAALLVVWNVLFAFQWAWGLTPKQGSVRWETVARNQVSTAPKELVRAAKLFFTDRGALVRHVQEIDLERRRAGHP